MLHNGATRAQVARAIGLSPSRVSAMFRGRKFPTKKALAEKRALLEKTPHLIPMMFVFRYA